ncbi:MAG: fimbrillin family protein [Bacteroidales bacterium]|nr:fimbrillin family protein [Bacteroidales bacterium]
MKKITAILLACTALLASCHHGRIAVDAPGDAILFSAGGSGLQVEAKSGSTLLEPGTFLDGDGFLVYGTWSLDEGGSAEIFREQEVTATGGYDSSIGGYECEYSPVKYWSKTGSYDFRAVFPSSAARVLSASSGKTIVAGYSMHMEDYDLMVAYASRSMNDADATDPVPLIFRHATAAVRFMFCKGEGVSINYFLNSISVGYIKTVGTFIWGAEDNSPLDDYWFTADYRPDSVLEWEAAAAEDRIPIYQKYSEYTGYQWHYVIPQSLADSDSYNPCVTFSVTIDDGAPVYTTIDLPTTYTDEGGIVRDAEWEAGKLYTYKIQIQPGDAQVVVEVTPWDKYKVAIDNMIFN